MSSLREQDSTARKLEREFDTAAKKQNAQTASVINEEKNQGKLQKQFSNQAREEFRQQESTATKIEKTLETGQQQQFAQTTSVINDTSGDGPSKLKDQFTQGESIKLK